MKRLITSLLTLLMIFTVSATVKEREFEYRSLPGAPQSSVSFVTKTDKSIVSPFMKETSIPKKSLKTSTKENVETVKAKLTFPPLGKDWRIGWNRVTFYNETESFEFDINPYDDEYNYSYIEEWEIEIPVGTYDVLAKFEKIDSDNTYFIKDSYLYYYIGEGITIGENSIIELRPEDCTVCLNMESTNPNGAKSSFRKIRYLNEYWEWEIIEEGNISEIYLDQLIIWKGNVIDNLSTNAGSIYIEPGPCGGCDPQKACNFYVNPVSDNYVFRSLRYMPAWPDENEGLYIAVTQCRGAVEGTYTNDSKYSLDESLVQPTPAFEQYPPIDSDYDLACPYSFSAYAVLEDGSQDWYGKGISSQKPSIWKIWSSGPANVYSEEEMYLTYSKGLVDAYIPEEYDWGTWIRQSSIYGPNVYPFADNKIINTVNPYGSFSAYENGETEPINLFPGNPDFMSFYGQQMIAVGGSAPLLTLSCVPVLDEETGNINNLYEYGYTGRMGEKLNSTENLCDVILTVNGGKVAEGKNEAYNWLAENPNVKGEYSFIVTTNNFSIGNIVGGNTANVVYNNENDDITPPSVTMLQMRNRIGNITQEFADIDDCELLITAADYSYSFGEPDKWGDTPFWYDLSAPAKVTAWCTPNGLDTEVVSEIELTQDIDAGIAHGFGALYRGSLDKLNLMSPNGWFDLTISVEDAAGNSQVQTLSPAFKIDTLTGISAVTTDASVTVNGNEIVAPIGSRIYNIGGSEVGSKSLPKGVYLVVTPEKTIKVAVR